MSRLLFVALALMLLAADRPNVVLIMTDDQGIGDLGCHGNPVIRTPHLDAFADSAARLTRCYVCPVCSPTRAALLTGRYNYRTGTVDTYQGRSMMRPEETTLAEALAAAGYRTGIFGKWHLGDCYPLRAIDQGFHDALVLRGGGIGQPSDPPGGEHYFDPVLFRNGRPEKTRGYCSDIFTDEAIRFIEANRERPFFCYLPFNCPHTPLEVADAEVAPYRGRDVSAKAFPATGFPIGTVNPENTARIYGMLTNIDRNLGRLFARLNELKLADNTIVVFLTDNGPQQERYKMGLRGLKGTVYEAGIRVPCFVRWSARIKAKTDVDRIAAHIDLMPTLLDACGVALPAGLDGRSLLPLLTGGNSADWPERTLFLQWHRGDAPERGRACTAITQRFKLVQANGVAENKPFKPAWQLFDLQADPGEQRDLAGDSPERVAELRKRYEGWFADVTKAGFAPVRIHVGSDKEPLTVLTRQDRRAADEVWELTVERGGAFDVTVTRKDTAAGKVTLSVQGQELTADLAAGTARHTFPSVALKPGPARLKAVGGWHVEMMRR